MSIFNKFYYKYENDNYNRQINLEIQLFLKLHSELWLDDGKLLTKIINENALRLYLRIILNALFTIEVSSSITSICDKAFFNCEEVQYANMQIYQTR